jgi:D-alanyl-D-alanine carboxypeptidase (penicillin-binding protein 5/6)
MKKKILLYVLSLALVFAAAFPTLNVKAYENNARAYYVADYDSGTVIEAKNENARYPIASMVKITSLSLVFDAIDEGRLSLDDDIRVSENAFGMGGSQAFLDKNATYKANDLIKSVIVASANDSCVALAEHLKGSVENFVKKMNDKAKELGMLDTNYVNCTGLPAEGGYSSAKDVATITKYLMKHDKFFDYAKVWMYDLVHPSGRKTTLTNTNKLVRFYDGMQGGKTGFTAEALSCLSCKAKRGNTEVICVVMGAPSGKERNSIVSSLLNAAFSSYETHVLTTKGDTVNGEARVNKGKQNLVGGIYGAELKLFGKKGERKNAEEKVEFYPLSAPIKAGQKIGEARFTENGEEIGVVDILAKNDVEEKDYGDFVKNFAQNW